MKNSDLAAYPFDINILKSMPDNDFEDAYKMASGLTKREYFAGVALQGLITSQQYMSQDTPRRAVIMADLLLEELEK